MRRSFLLALSSMVLVMVLGALALPAQAATQVVVSYTATADFGAAFIAKEQGFFAKRGLDVTLQSVPVAPNVPAALMSNSVQIGGTTPSVLLQAVDSGLDLVAVAGGGTFDLKGSPAPIGIAVRSGLAVRGGADLVGKKIAVPGFGAAIHVLTRRWLMAQGVDPKQVTFVEVGVPQMPDVLKGGSVDAVAVPEPFLARIVQAGIGTAVPSFAASLPDGVSTVLYTATRQWAAQNRAAVVAFREALAEGAQFAATQREAALQDFGKYIRVPAPILKAMPYPHFEPVLQDEQLRFWSDTMRTQDMLRRQTPLSTTLLK
jgi:NitT/TauT family transport system substrate-binding protein